MSFLEGRTTELPCRWGGGRMLEMVEEFRVLVSPCTPTVTLAVVREKTAQTTTL